MLKNNAARYPDDTALIELAPSNNYRRTITWKAFNDQSNRIANYLISRGIKKDDKVVHWMRNSIPWLVIYFGIIKTGAWAVPLNYRFTPDDFKFCAEIAEAKAIFFEEEFKNSVLLHKDSLPTIRDYVYCGSDVPAGCVKYDDIIADNHAEPIDVVLTPDDECGLYFTSGTTGAPKPVLLTHKNMSFAAKTEKAHHFQTKKDNFILLPPLYHTVAKIHWMGSLLSGSRATILKEFSPQILFDTIHKEKGTIVWLLVPWVHDVLVALDNGKLKISNYELKQWRLMHIGAQPVPTSLVRHWKSYFPDMQYDNNYGLSESTGPGPVHLGIGNQIKDGAVGKAGNGWQLKVMHIEDDRNVPSWIMGELAVKGDGVMKEYYKNPELTSNTIKDGWLLTGDMARIDNDGYVYLVDRKKDVIIMGGENIYPTEVEDIIHKHPKVYDVAVIGIPDERLVEIPAAIIAPKEEETLTEEEILNFLDPLLPRYKKPRKIIFDKVPRNATGKIEKPKLRLKYGSVL